MTDSASSVGAFPSPIAPPTQPAARARTGAIAVSVQHLHKRYGAIHAVDDLSFEIYEGEIFGLLGPNGAGKTTTISVLDTRLRPSSGDAVVFGFSVTNRVRRVRRLIGVVPQEIALYPKLSARENVKFFARMYKVPASDLNRRVDELLELVGLDARANDPVDVFSGGMKRRLNLAVSLVHRPRLVLLDEPTVGVDPHSREHIFSIVSRLRDEGVAILYTTHYMEEAERLCDRIGIMDEGRIIALGTLEELLREAGCSEVVELRGLPPRTDLGPFRTIDGVCRFEQLEGVARLFVTNVRAVLGPLDELLGQLAVPVSVQIMPLSLENLFLQLTGKELRD